MGNKRYDTPLAVTPEPTYSTVKSIMKSKENQNNNRYSAIHKEFSSLTNSDGSGISSFVKQNEKESGKIKYKSYDVSNDASGTPTRLEINRQTNTGNSRTRVITDPEKIKRKMTRVANRNK